MTTLIVLIESAAIDGPAPFTIQSRAVGKPSRLLMTGQAWGHSFLRKPVVINEAQGPQGGILIQYVQPPRQARKTRSDLFGFIPPPTPPPLARPTKVELAPSPRQARAPHSRLPEVVYGGKVYDPIQGYLTPPLSRVPPTMAKLSPPTVLASPPGPTFGGPRVKLVPPLSPATIPKIRNSSRLRPPAIQTYLAVPSLVSLFPLLGRVPAVRSRLRPPELPVKPPNAPLAVHLTYSRRGKPRSKLSPPAWTRSFGEIKTTLAPQRRGTPKSRLSPPAIQTQLAVPALVNLFPLTNRVPAVHSKLSGPATLVAASILYFGPSVTLAPQRRGAPKSSLHGLVYSAAIYEPIRGYYLPRVYVPPVHSKLSPPATLVAAAVLYAVSVTLAPSRRPVAKSRLLSVPSAFQPVGSLRVHLAYSLRGKPKSKLRPPVVVFPFFARPTEITLARIRPVKTHPRLSPPAVVAPVLARKIEVTLAPQRRGAPKSILHPPVPPETFRGIRVVLTPSKRGKPRSFFVATPIAFQAVEIYGPETTLVRIRPPRTMWLLGPMGPPAVVYAPLSVNLTYSRRGAPKSFLPQASLYAPQPKAEYDIKVTLAPQRRGKPKSFLRPPARVNAATPYFRELPVTLAPQKRGKPKSFLRPPTVVRYFVARPALVSLAPSRFPRPKSRLYPPTDVVDLQDLGSIQVTLAPSRFPRPKSKLLGVIYAARVYAPIRVTLAPSRFPTPKSRLLPPAVVEAAFIQINPTRWLVRITPPRTHSRLRPPAVVGAGVYFRGIQVHLAYSVRGKPKSRLSYTAIAIEECYGHVVCGFDFAAVVCGTDDSPDVTGGDTSGSAVSGTDSAATVTGTSASSGSVSGGDERREGC